MKRTFVLCTAIYMAACVCAPMRVAAQELPPVPSDLVDTSAVTCIRVSQSGSVEGSFILASTGDSARDAEVLEWVRQLHWPQAKPDEKLRGEWFPMPVSFGQAKPLPMPSSCSPPLHGASR
jgi:TonB family protein